MSASYAKALGARLRAIRQQQDLSLSAVEAKSHGKWKAVVVGSYERGDRAITVAKLAELAEFYGVPLGELVPEGAARVAAMDNDKVRFLLPEVHALGAEKGRLLARYLAAIQTQRPKAHLQTLPGLEGVIGADADALTRQFGAPRLDVREGDARKLQWSGTPCVLDAYLYPGEGGGRPIATFVDARRGDGRDVDRAACVAALRKPR